MQVRRFWWASAVLVITSGCGNSADFTLHSTAMDCDRRTCIVTIDVENIGEAELPLVYEASLSKNYVRDPNKNGLTVVGKASGEFTLSPRDRQRIEVVIEVTEEPTGSKVTIFDSRTPDFVRSILES